MHIFFSFFFFFFFGGFEQEGRRSSSHGCGAGVYPLCPEARGAILHGEVLYGHLVEGILQSLLSCQSQALEGSASEDKQSFQFEGDQVSAGGRGYVYNPLPGQSEVWGNPLPSLYLEERHNTKVDSNTIFHF